MKMEMEMEMEIGNGKWEMGNGRQQLATVLALPYPGAFKQGGLDIWGLVGTINL